MLAYVLASGAWQNWGGGATSTTVFGVVDQLGPPMYDDVQVCRQATRKAKINNPLNSQKFQKAIKITFLHNQFMVYILSLSSSLTGECLPERIQNGDKFFLLIKQSLKSDQDAPI